MNLDFGDEGSTCYRLIVCRDLKQDTIKDIKAIVI